MSVDRSRSIIDEVASQPIVANADCSGMLAYRSPRLSGDYVGRITASLDGVTGNYTAYDRSIDDSLDSSIVEDDERGNLVSDDEQATITASGAAVFVATRAAETHSSRNVGAGGSATVEIRFNAGSLDVEYSDRPVAFWRYVYSDVEMPIGRRLNGEFRDRAFFVRQGNSIDDRSFVAVAHDGEQLNALEERALWLSICFLCGAKAGQFVVESYDEDGGLIRRRFRGGQRPPGTAYILFNVYMRPPENVIASFASGFHDALADGFPVDVIFEQVFDSTNSVVDFQIQNCLLAIHAAFEAWHKIRPTDVASEKAWLAKNKAGLLVALDGLLETAPTRVRNALTNAVNAAANVGTGDKERRFFQDWNIDVSNAGLKKTLALRNGLLHDGYFNRRFEDIEPAEQQFRIDAIGVLKDVIVTVLFRCVGCSGGFLSQRNYFSHVNVPAGEPMFPLQK
jgi:hypothetical protein